METVTIAPGLRSSRVGFGCAGLMREPSRHRRQELLAGAHDRGITHFDVARMYGLGAAEGELGRFLRGRRDELTVATKFGIEPARSVGRLAPLQGPARALLARFPHLRAHIKRGGGKLDAPHRYDVATARRSLERSLRELRTDYVDILFLHGPSAIDTIDLQALCAFLEDVRRRGLVRAWGLAGERTDCLGLAASLPGGTLVQTREDVYSRRSRASGAPAHVIYGVLADALPRIAEHGWPPICAGETPAGRPADRLASLLVADALQTNPHGVVLFSTTQPARLATVDAAIDLLDRREHELDAFRRWLEPDLVHAGTSG
jgi:aryl-alcohol dehydrogenase-like predicted oxidoreductase